MAETEKIEETVVDNSEPYPEAPEADDNDPNQPYYRGIRSFPRKIRVRQQPPAFPGRAGNYPNGE